MRTKAANRLDLRIVIVGLALILIVVVIAILLLFPTPSAPAQKAVGRSRPSGASISRAIQVLEQDLTATAKASPEP